MRGFDVIPSELGRASRVWDEQASRLLAVHRRLEAAETAAGFFGERAGPETRRFLRGWARRAQVESAAAARWAEALSKIGRTYVWLDEEAADDLRQALPWGSAQSIRPSTHGLPARLPSMEPMPPAGPDSGPAS